ncbi:hypothetical protein NE686_19385 [Tissierella carlieri]|uniref:Uncharacterized protein n=1 Tax=Tissierella carlieri TaxID=689904 RepID=A0ABT1SFP0_9FIRM|nr:hypothetical protein [Tissierella carlieri]MCQ4925276.1 hypothetical protein [Tissierella carlieri]
MVESLLFIARDLLRSLGVMEFTEDEKDYIAYVASRVMAVLSIELEKGIMIE